METASKYSGGCEPAAIVEPDNVIMRIAEKSFERVT